MSYQEENKTGFYRNHKKLVIFGSIGLVLFFIFVSIMIGITKRVQAEAGVELVIVDKPFWTIFGKGGVREEPLSTGAMWLFYTTDIVPYDLRPVQYTEAFDDEKDGTITADNVPIDFKAYIKLRSVQGKTPRLHVKFGVNWYNMNVKEVFRTSVRDEVAQQKMTALTTRQIGEKGDVLGNLGRKVFNEMVEFVKTKGLDVEVMEVIIGKATPPQKILDSLTATADQQQRAKTEIERRLAEIQRKEAEGKRAEADNEYRNKIGFSPEQFMVLELAKKQVEAVTACSKNANCTAIIGELGVAATLPLKK